MGECEGRSPRFKRFRLLYSSYTHDECRNGMSSTPSEALQMARRNERALQVEGRTNSRPEMASIAVEIFATPFVLASR